MLKRFPRVTGHVFFYLPLACHVSCASSAVVYLLFGTSRVIALHPYQAQVSIFGVVHIFRPKLEKNVNREKYVQKTSRDIAVPLSTGRAHFTVHDRVLISREEGALSALVATGCEVPQSTGWNGSRVKLYWSISRPTRADPPSEFLDTFSSCDIEIPIHSILLHLKADHPPESLFTFV